MGSAAHITSTEAVREFRAALQQYEADVRDAIAQLLLELRRGLAWVEQDRANYWPREARVATDALIHAQQELANCESAIRAEDRRSCYEQRMAVEKAKARLRLCEQKVRAVRRWRVTVDKESEALHGRLLKLTDFLDTEFPRALAALGRMAAALDKYTERSVLRDAGAAGGSTDVSSSAPPGGEGQEVSG